MITITPCTTSDCAAVAQLWNLKTLDATSCWFEAGNVDAAYVGNLLSDGYSVVLARVDATPAGFGMWCGPPELPRLVALAADDADVYYHLMAAFCDEGRSWGAQRGFAEIGTAPTSEKARMDALEVIEYTAIGFEPLAPDEPTSERVPKLLRAECDLATLDGRLIEILGGAP
jgi:hypothetical protein